MPFDLKNAGATYQRCMPKGFRDLIGRTIEAYVNPEKCIFRVPRDMLLGFIISECGIEANPEKISAITRMGSIQNIKGVQ